MSDPRPGTAEAIAKGCTCPVMDNHNGKGAYGNADRYGYWFSAGCPLHECDAHALEIMAAIRAETCRLTDRKGKS